MRQGCFLTCILSCSLLSAEPSPTPSEEAPKAAPHYTADAFEPLEMPRNLCSNGIGLYGTTSFLYWTADRDSEIATRVTSGPGDRLQLSPQLLEIDFEPGFKLGVGLRAGEREWDLLVNWTWLQLFPHRSLKETTPVFASSVTGIRRHDTDLGLSSGVHSKGMILFDALDIELGASYLVRKRLALRPLIGLKGNWIKENLKSHFTGAQNIHGDPLSDVDDRLKSQMWGLGPRLGVNSRWQIGRSDFALLGNASFSMLWEKYLLNVSESYADANGVPQGRSSSLHQGSLQPVMELFIGFDWSRCLSERFYLSVGAGYEMQYWWSIAQISTGTRARLAEPLKLQGLTASMRLDF